MEARPILVVEDDGAVRRLIAACLKDDGLRCLAVADAESAIEAVARATFDAALVDNGLPGMSGLELLGHLRAVDPTLPVLFVTGAAEPEDRVRGLDAGAADYVVKPFDPDELTARVRAHLRGRRAWASAVHDELARRAAVVRALGAVDPASGLRPAARTICDAVMASGDAEGAAIAWFDHAGEAEILSAQGVLGGDALAAHAASTGAVSLRLRAAGGPWIEPLGWGEELIACAPVGTGATPAGVLYLVAHDGDGADPLVGRRALSAAGDFAAVATTLLEVAARAEGAVPAVIDLAAVAPDDLTGVFQPVVELRSGGVAGWEGLTRFAHGASAAAEFARAAAEGRGAELEIVAAARLVEAGRDLPAGHFLAVNLSSRLVVERGHELHDLLERAGRPMVVELTEHDPVGDYPSLRRALERLPAKVSVDDAGAGFSTLRHVMLLEPDYVKLDRSWVAGIDSDPARQALVAGIVHYARVTGAHLVAEGVETEPELAWLRWLEVEMAQGYLLGRPAPVDAWVDAV
jgi:EAL domain-containing protein (putative c-di-GMP-specific phosphodiesterase class I)/CheY-like chemotaxis protein